ncbi:MAG TPA: (d)CMP kinase [Saprospiraceae bacterium]|nr:(d)CMP kinase [Saprospiraceae bacterium]HRG20135.1 (d)CMP kinase [Saprospiraceae bacterium]
MIIAIDGFSSCGKSTIAKALAAILKLPYIDSGAMYRAVTWYFLEHQIDFMDEHAVYDALNHISIKFVREGDQNVLYCNGRALREELRSMEVSNKVSEVSAIPEVRIKMVTLQQQMGSNGAVMDGRDIGTVVFPEADFKFFLIADPTVRARRRFDELKEKNEDISLEEVIANLNHRDHIDSTREHSPLRKADDAIEIDNTHLSKEEQIQVIIKYLNPSA